MKLFNSPVYEQTYTFADQTKTFTYNVISALSNVTLTAQSEQAPVLSVVAGDILTDAKVTVDVDIVAALNNIQVATGQKPVIYFVDKSPVAPNYTGLYFAFSWETSSTPGRTNIILKRQNGGSSYLGPKTFSADGSQLIYKPKGSVQIDFFNRTKAAGFQQNSLILSKTQQLLADGSTPINFSELAKPLISAIGCTAIQAVVTEFSLFGTEATVTSDILNFVNSSLYELNYGNLTLFNPNTGGSILNSTGAKLYYNTQQIYPFFINTVANDEVAAYTINTVLLSLDFKDIDNSILDSVEVDVSANVGVGLNIIDLSLYPAVLEKLIDLTPHSIDLTFKYSGLNEGEFDAAEFDNAEFDTADDFYTSTSGTSNILCEFYVLDNRRDFYIYFNNGVGGFSSYLFKSYKRIVEPEILSLRNNLQLANYVARSTQRVELAANNISLEDIKFLTGNDLFDSLKENGIYESQRVTRVGALGVKTNWLVVPTSYEQSNAEIYEDFKIQLYRPVLEDRLNAAISTVEIIDVTDVTETSAKINCKITQIGIGAVYKKGVQINGVFYENLTTALEYSVTVSALTSATNYTVFAKITTQTGETLSRPKFFTTL